MEAVANPCAVCQTADANSMCSRCKLVRYCSVDCQKHHWKIHKKTCVDVHQLCTRCEQPLSNNNNLCVIPHPISCRRDMGAIYSGERRQFYGCEACNKNWTEVKTGGYKDVPLREFIEGPQYCFEGPHTKSKIPASDKRVLRSTELNLLSNSNLQNELDALSTTHPMIKKLTIHMGTVSCGSVRYSFTAILPHLQELTIDGVQFKKFVLTNENTPKLSFLHLTNLGDVSKDSCDFNVTTSSLKNIEIYFMDSDQIKPINNMLRAATKLESFACRKLQVYHNSLVFNSNYLKSITVVRSDCLPGKLYYD